MRVDFETLAPDWVDHVEILSGLENTGDLRPSESGAIRSFGVASEPLHHLLIDRMAVVVEQMEELLQQRLETQESCAINVQGGGLSLATRSRSVGVEERQSKVVDINCALSKCACHREQMRQALLADTLGL